MKKIKLFRFLAIVLPVALLVFVFGCKKNELNSKELLLFVKGDYGTTNNSINASLTWTPTSVWGNKSFSIPVYATHEVPVNVDVYLYPDDRFVSKFNQANGTNYQLLPPFAYKVLNDVKHSIKAGTVISDSLNIQIKDTISVLNDTRGYILPLTVTKYESDDKGPQISSTNATVYLVIPYKYSNVDSVQTLLTGTMMSRTAWSATVSNTFSGTYPATNLLDNNNTTAWRSSNSSSAAKWFIINMGSAQTVKGFVLTPDYVATAENPTQITISTSNDNVTYTNQGVWNGTGPSASSSASSPDTKGINFITPITARYFQFTINKWVSTNVAGVGEVNAVQ